VEIDGKQVNIDLPDGIVIYAVSNDTSYVPQIKKEEVNVSGSEISANATVKA
jgi:hypothetical protein